MTTLRLHNTLTRQKTAFVPVDPHHIRMYVCGPTVYDRAHLGNARSAVVFDCWNRLLRRLYPRVTYVRNITDVDDKINHAAQAQGVTIDSITQMTTQWYHEDMAALHVLTPDHEPRATAYISAMITMITQLIARGHAYAAEGHVLFRVQSFAAYGQFSGSTPDAILAGARIETAPFKENPADFVLWKPSDHTLPGWESPWGRGRPGWHIECSAMSQDLLGFPFDIHGGGQDLIFPHHENEIAQGVCAHAACAASSTGESVTIDDATTTIGSVARHWLHNGFLTVDGEKMSKSRGNFLCVHDLLQHHPGEVIRLALMTTHYRQALDWTAASLRQAQQTLDRFYTALQRAEILSHTNTTPLTLAQDNTLLEALCDDMNTPLAISLLHDRASAVLRGDADAQEAARALLAGGSLLGIFNHTPQTWFTQPTHVSENQASAPSVAEIEALVTARQAARDARDFAQADAIRAQLLGHGIVIEDSAGETRWRRLRT